MTKIKLLDCYTEKSPFLNKWEIGKADFSLMLKLIKAGASHRKFLRLCVDAADNWSGTNSGENYINDWCDERRGLRGMFNYKEAYNTILDRYFVPSGFIRAMRAAHESYNKSDSKIIEKIKVDYCGKGFYFFELDYARDMWHQIGTYKEETTFLSSSTMYNIMKKKLIKEDFICSDHINQSHLDYLNNLISEYKTRKLDKETKYKLFRAIKANLPEGYIQKRFWFCTKDVLKRVIEQRKTHYLRDWQIITNEFERVLEVE